jgi:hypothetical protein
MVLRGATACQLLSLRPPACWPQREREHEAMVPFALTRAVWMRSNRAPSGVLVLAHRWSHARRGAQAQRAVAVAAGEDAAAVLHVRRRHLFHSVRAYLRCHCSQVSAVLLLASTRVRGLDPRDCVICSQRSLPQAPVSAFISTCRAAPRLVFRVCHAHVMCRRHSPAGRQSHL